MADAQLLHAQLRVALLAVADDEKPMGLMEGLQGLTDFWVADVAGILGQVPVLPDHAALHKGIADLLRLVREQRVGNFRHGFPEETLEPLRVHGVALHSLVPELEVEPLGHQGPGIPEGTVDIKDQAVQSSPPSGGGGCG